MASRVLAPLLLLTVAVADAQAEPLWDKVQNPHVAEVRRLSAEAQALKQGADNIYQPHQRPIAQRIRRQAAEKMCRAADLAPDQVEILLQCGRFARAAEDYAPSASAYSRALRLDSTSLTANDHQFDAVALLALGRLDEATLAVGRGLALERGGGEGGSLRPTLALIRMADGRLDEAADQLELATASNGGDACLFHLLAVVYDRDEQVGRAVEALDRASSIDSTFAHLSGYSGCSFEPLYVGVSERHYFYALAYERMGQLADAADAWRAYLGSARPRYAGRARAHLAELARQLDAPPPPGGVVGGIVP